MMSSGSLNSGRLVAMLRNSLDKERRCWKPTSYASGRSDDEVTDCYRDEAASWIVSINGQLHFNPETVVLAITVLDNFLQVVKVKPKYLRCVAISAYYLAAKILEEDEVVPSVQEMVENIECGCSACDILRMERIILDKLHWDLGFKTALDFLHIFHSLVLTEDPAILSPFRDLTAGKQLSLLTKKLLICLSSAQVTVFTPSAVALSLLSLELGLFTRNWLAATIVLQKMIGLSNTDLIRCREVACHILAQNRHLVHPLNAIYQNMVRHSSALTPQTAGLSYAAVCALPAKRKAGETECSVSDGIYDGIKRLYGEDGTATPSSFCGEDKFRALTPGSLMMSPATIKAN